MISIIEGHIHCNKVEFHKTYDGAGGYGQTVHYKGTLDANAGKVSGEWRLSSASGKFEMSRILDS